MSPAPRAVPRRPTPPPGLRAVVTREALRRWRVDVIDTAGGTDRVLNSKRVRGDREWAAEVAQRLVDAAADEIAATGGERFVVHPSGWKPELPPRGADGLIESENSAAEQGIAAWRGPKPTRWWRTAAGIDANDDD